MYYQAINGCIYKFTNAPELGDEATLNSRGIFQDIEKARQYGLDRLEDELFELNTEMRIIKNNISELISSDGEEW